MAIWHPEPTKRLIYDSQTGQYLTGAGTWSVDEEKAKNFPSVFQALEFSCRNQVTDAELVFKFEDGRCQASLPLTDNPAGHDLTISQLLQAQQLPWE